MILYNDVIAIEHIERMAPVIFSNRGGVCIARFDSKMRFMGGAIMDNFTGEGGSMCMHVYGRHPRWLNRELLDACFYYVFKTAKVRWAMVQVKSTNLKSLQFTEKLGFKDVTTIPQAFPDGDMVVRRMGAHECRWLNLRPRRGQYGKVVGTAAA